MFPQGGPGVALLLIRICVAATLVISGWNHVGVWSTRPLFAGAALMAALLCLGLLTPYVAVVACVAAVANLALGSDPASLSQFLPICDAAALALLGPGAYSVDARLFGRRVVVLPARKDPNHSS